MLGTALGLALSIVWGCATGGAGGFAAYSYFANPDPGDAWSRKIEMWQSRERAEHAAATPLQPVSEADVDADAALPTGALRAKFEAFRAKQKREMARGVAEWIQARAQEHYVADGPIDHWATLDETFRTNGDDCDGLELLVYHLLRDLGFEGDEVFRAIVYRRGDGQHHMVTMWFEDPDDPWVIDPTGAMTSGMPRMSSLRDWVPLKVFTEERDYTVESKRIARN